MFIRRGYVYQNEENGGEGTGGEGGPPGQGDAAIAAENWRDSLPDEIKANPALANFQDIGQMAKSFIDMKSFQGDSIRIPGQDAGDDDKQKFVEKLVEKAPNLMLKPNFDNPEQTNEFYRTLGKPEKSDQYGTPEIKDLPEGTVQNEDRLAFFRTLAHEANLTKNQFDKIMSEVTKADVVNAQSQMEKQKQEMEGLKQEWGMATDERLSKIETLASKTGAPDHLIEAIKNKSIPADIAKWIYSLSESLGDEGVNLLNNENGHDTTMTPAEANDKIQEIYRNKEHPFHKGDPTALKRMIELVAAANPNSSTNINDLYSGRSIG